MAEKADLIKENIIKFYELINHIYPVKKVFLYGSYAKGNQTKESDIDVGVVIDYDDHLKRIEITADLFHNARKIDSNIEPKCIFLDEYKSCEKTSILAEIIRTGIAII